MRECQQADHRAAGMAIVAAGEQHLEGAGVGSPRKQLLAIDEIEQRHGLPAQCMDHMVIVDDVSAFVGSRWAPATSQRQDRRRAEEALEPVVVEADTKVVADELRGDGIEHLAQDEAAAGGDPYPRFLVVARACLRQLLEQRALDFEPLAVLAVVASNDLVDEPAVGGKILKVARAAQQQRILDWPWIASIAGEAFPVTCRVVKAW